MARFLPRRLASDAILETMNLRLWLGCMCLLAATACLGADVGSITIVGGKARLLRGTAWYKLTEGAIVRDADVLDAPEGAELQIELPDGSAVSIAGPGSLYVAAVAPRDARQSGVVEFFLTRGWAKVAAKPNESRLRLRTPLGTIVTANAIAVTHATPEVVEAFVESGSVKCVEPGKSDGAAPQTKAGEFCSRAPGKAFTTAGRPPSPFLTALPRQFMDSLPMRAAKFKNSPAEPVMDREATFAEIQTWFGGPYRAAFLKRFEPRLSDPSFQAAVSSNAKAYPEWNTPAPPPPAPQVEAPKESAKPPSEPERKWRWPWEKAAK